MNYEIHVRELAPQVVVTERRHATLAELGKAMRSTLAKVTRSVAPPEPMGAPFAVYYNEPFRPEDIDVEMGLPVSDDAKVLESHDIHLRVLSGGPVAYTLHVGPYAAIGSAYDALYKWIDDHGHERTGPPREIYVVGPSQGVKPSEYRTEIEVPID